jgi:hypothetical protein
MVDWLAPGTLLGAARETVLSGLFARFADKREQEAGLEGFDDRRQATHDETWIDYVSDLGDGFASTYAVARLLAADTLDAGGEQTRRGSSLVMGGDQVYPSANWRHYQEKMAAPYGLAWPEIEDADPDEQTPLYAVPGNHDWYDGLTSFMRRFAQGSAIGNWRTRQRRSYFALPVAEDWWLWGIDIQFDAYMDGPQVEYFHQAAEALNGGRVILATAKPSWIHVDDSDHPPDSWMNLAFVRDKIIGDHGTVAVTLTGDLHHYSRYMPTSGSGEPMVTAGGGGAYLSPTHWLPERLGLPTLDSTRVDDYELERCWPDRQASAGFVRGITRQLSPTTTPGLNWLMAGIYGLLALLLSLGMRDNDPNLAISLRGHGVLARLSDMPSLVFILIAAGLTYGLGAWAKSGGGPARAGVLHGLGHLSAIYGLTLAGLSMRIGLDDEGFWQGYLVAAAVGVLGIVAGRCLLVSYLLLAQRHDPRFHANEVFAGQSRSIGPDYKNFVRLRICGDELTLWALGIERVPRQWGFEARPEPLDRALEHRCIDRLVVTVPINRPAGQ